METQNGTKASYGNWVSDRLIFMAAVMFVVFGAASGALFALAHAFGAAAVVFGALFTVVSVFFLACIVYFVTAKNLFSYDGGRVQGKILEMFLSHVKWDGRGRALDIGCGSGALAILLAKEYPDAAVTGVDYWGGSWGYYQKQCQDNAALEGVAARTDFIRASASSLPFADETFDLAVSNLVFHEVKDSRDKRDVIREALRVVKKGGSFVFQDLFLLEQYYGKTDDLVADLKASGVQEVQFIDTSKAKFIPKALKLPFMVGTLGMLVGVK